jgi:predicted DNA-binding protein (MmcQ/YjbR family)
MSGDLRARVAALCAGLPGAEASDPWGGGHDAWKVGGKMFACLGATDPGVSVKCADVETAALLIETGVAERAPYFHRSWVRLPETVGDDELAHRVRASYALIRAGLPKKAQAALAAGGQG